MVAVSPFARPDQGLGSNDRTGRAGDVSLGDKEEPREQLAIPGPRKSPKSDRSDRDVGAALRTVYQKTVEEKVPDEFLDLLGKLG